MKKMKKIMAAAIAMRTFSTAAAVTGTVAWFTASNVVTASGMSLQADTEQGINISNEAKEVWKESAVASHTGVVGSGENAQQKFIPTTTEDAVTWKHGNSDDRNNSDAVGELETLTLASPVVDGIAKVNKNGSSINGKNVYLVNKFYLRSSIPAQITAPKLYVNLVEATGTATDSDLDLSFRVLVKYSTTIKVFAPFEETADTKAPAIIKGTKNTLLAENVIIPAASDVSTDDALEIEVYCYFEGKDSNCKSANIKTTFNTLAVSCKFGTEEIA